MNELFVRESVTFLRDTYVPRLKTALETLPEGDLWWKPHEGAISFGTILLHLAGNVRQWIISGLGGAADHRERAGEFAASDGPSGEELLDRLRQTVEEACAVIEAMDEEALTRGYTIQGFEVTGVHAVYHVTEHFSWHTGQAAWIAKCRAGADHGLAYYDESAINSAKN